MNNYLIHWPVISEIHNHSLQVESCSKKIEWLTNCIKKKIEKGIEPSLEHLSHCSTVKKIICEAYKSYCETYGYFKFHKDERRATEEYLATQILEKL